MKRFDTDYMVFLVVVDQVLTGIALWVAATVRLGSAVLDPTRPGPGGISVFVYFLVAGLWLFAFILLSAYNPHHVFRAVNEIQIVLAGIGLASLGLAGAFYFLEYGAPRLMFGYFILLDVALLVGYRLALRLYHRARNGRPENRTNVLIVGAGKVGKQIAEAISELNWAGLVLVGFLDDDPGKADSRIAQVPVLGACADAARIVERENIDEIIVSLPPRAHGRMVNIVAELQRLPVRVKVVPDYFDMAFARTTQEHLADIPLISLRDPAITGLPRMAKRVFDLVVGIVLLLVASPLLIAIAAAIRLDSPGPALFKQQRVGENSRLFWMFKFRSMVQDAEALQAQMNHVNPDGSLVHKHRDDPRVTRVGRWLRRYSIDELPNLLNVIRGEMSLVGPRPELPWLVDKYEPWQRKRFAVPQGMTGWWQINGRSDNLMHLHTQDDLYYIQNYSLILDLQILWRTVGVVFKGPGAF